LAVLCGAASASEGLRGLRVKAVAGLVGASEGDPAQHALLVGINRYAEWPSLVTPVADAKGLRDVLFERYHFDAEHTIERYDADACGSNILQALSQIGAQADENDSVLIYFAGHGSEDGYWIPSDGSLRDRTRWISSDTVRSVLKTCPARHVLIVSDSCFAGDFLMKTRGVAGAASALPADIRHLYSRKSRYAMTSGGHEPVKDQGLSTDHSIFAHFLITALRSNRSPFLTPSSSPLFGYVRDGLAANPLGQTQTPLYGQILDAGSASGEYVFFLAEKYVDRAAATAAVTQPARQTEAPSGRDDAWLEGRDTGGKTVSILVTHPSDGVLKIGTRGTYRLAGDTEVRIGEGLHRFILEIPDGDRIYGEMKVANIDEEARLTQFGLGEGIFFKRTHIRAAQEGRPVRYSVVLQGASGPREIISYVMSLRRTR
jgi:hypothetical protein